MRKEEERAKEESFFLKTAEEADGKVVRRNASKKAKVWQRKANQNKAKRGKARQRERTRELCACAADFLVRGINISSS